MKRILLVGGGHAHAWVLREGIPGDVTLVTPYPHHTYSGMLPGFVAGHYAAEEIRIDVAALAARVGVKLLLGRIVALDAKRRMAKSGVYAVRHAPVLAANLRGGDTRYSPQRRALALISCGSRYAIAEWGGVSWGGAWVWRWKDRIDRKWVERFRR